MSQVAEGRSVKERPILFSGPMVRAILSGSKTVTRRVVKPQPDEDGLSFLLTAGAWQDTSERIYRCPFGRPSDRLWVREVAAWNPDFREPSDVWYRADPKWDEPDSGYFPDNKNWRSPIHMPRWASRLTLEVVSVRVERLQAITEDDIDAEGFGGDFPAAVRPDLFPDPEASGALSMQECFARVWDDINGKKPGHAWDANPWVWVVEFRKVEA